VAADPSGATLFFGLSSYHDWSSANEVVFNIWIDNNEDGTWDRVVFNSSLGQVSRHLFGSTANNPQDNYLSFVFTPPGTVSSQLFINTSPATADTVVLNNDVLVIPVLATAIGLSAGNNDFRYRIETCPYFSPLCSALPSFVVGSGLDDSGAGFATWNRTARGLSFGGILFEDLNTDTVPVTWNTANLAANGSPGGLFLHHHNTEGSRAEVVLLDTAPSADLEIAKLMQPPTPALGDTVTFTLLLFNNGPASASGITVFDLLPAGMTYVTDNGGGSYNPATGGWTIGGTLAPFSGTSLQIVTTLDTTAEIENVAQISTASPLDPDPSDNTSRVVINAPESADLALAMAASAPTVLAGGSFDIDLAATNNGDDTAFSIAVNELFTGFEPLVPTAATASAGVYNPATGLWNLPSLGIVSGTSATLSLTFTAPNVAGPLTNDGTASAVTADPDNSNNTASATVLVLSPAALASTKTVAGTFTVGSTVTYTVTLANSSVTDQQDNAGDELVDVLPPELTLVSAVASSGSAVASVGTNTVTWNGVVPGGGSVAITITATIDPGTEGLTVANQGTFAFDADGDGGNEASGATDDPGEPGAADPTSFVVLSPAAVSATKTVAGNFIEGGAITYTVVIENAGLAQLDNPGDELIDVLPPELTLAGATASSGTAVADPGTNTVSWNGSIPAGGSVTISIDAVIGVGVGNVLISNQGTISSDADGNGTNEASALTDDPAVGGAQDPTVFGVGGAIDIPTLSALGLAVLALVLAGAASLFLRRRRAA
jgi:uncharacterized repeat protein (TIGR01451 family)